MIEQMVVGAATAEATGYAPLLRGYQVEAEPSPIALPPERPVLLPSGEATQAMPCSWIATVMEWAVRE